MIRGSFKKLKKEKNYFPGKSWGLWPPCSMGPAGGSVRSYTNAMIDSMGRVRLFSLFKSVELTSGLVFFRKLQFYLPVWIAS